MIWKAEQLSAALGVEVQEGISTNIIQFNSQNVKPGDLFIALTGGARDGHDFVLDAEAKGAAALIVDRKIAGVDSKKLIKVDDTYQALIKLANYKRRNSQAKFIAITGSVGKTSTKEALQLILSGFGRSFASRANFNNYLGLQINLASLPDDAQYAIFELGMSAAGEIAVMTKQLKPDIALITKVALVHAEFFNSIYEIADAKSEIFQGLDKDKGLAILLKTAPDYDEALYDRVLANIKALGLSNIRAVSDLRLGQANIGNESGLERGNGRDVIFLAYDKIGDYKVKLNYKVHQEHVEFIMPYVPEHIAVNFAMCLAVIGELDLNLLHAVKGLANFELMIGRGGVVNIRRGGNNFAVITDYYNSSPASLKAALNNLALRLEANKVAIIGDMGELGSEAERLHREIADHINQTNINKVFLIGELAAKMKEKLNDKVYCQIYNTVTQLLADLQEDNSNDLLGQGGAVLIKASRFMHFEKIANYLGVKDAL